MVHTICMWVCKFLWAFALKCAIWLVIVTPCQKLVAATKKTNESSTVAEKTATPSIPLAENF